MSFIHFLFLSQLYTFLLKVILQNSNYSKIIQYFNLASQNFFSVEIPIIHDLFLLLRLNLINTDITNLTNTRNVFVHNNFNQKYSKDRGIFSIDFKDRFVIIFCKTDMQKFRKTDTYMNILLLSHIETQITSQNVKKFIRCYQNC